MAHNNYFQFKQFRVEQINAAMRVGTDGVLLGAWIDLENARYVLDIGTGTGVIALMIAQRSAAIIDAIDIEAGAIADARLNFAHSPWANRLNLTHISIQEWVKQAGKKYDCIVSNPPFFQNSIQSVSPQKSIARHTTNLNYQELFESVSLLLNTSGAFSIVVPSDTKQQLVEYANQKGLYLTKITKVVPKPGKPCKRLLLQFKFQQDHALENELMLETEVKHVYTQQAIDMLKNFYLNL